MDGCVTLTGQQVEGLLSKAGGIEAKVVTAFLMVIGDEQGLVPGVKAGA